MFFGSFSKSFLVGDMKQTRLNGHVYDFLIGFGSIDVDDILDIHKYLMNKHKNMIGLIKKTFTALPKNK